MRKNGTVDDGWWWAGMLGVFRRIGRDVRQLRNIDAYAVALVVFVFAVLSVAGDILPINARWAVLLIGMGVLVFRMTLPDPYQVSADGLLEDRSAFEDKPFPARLRAAKELWVFAPSANNVLTPQHCDTIRTTILASPDGVARVVVLNPSAKPAVEMAARQLADSVDYPSSRIFRSSLEATVRQLQGMAAWNERGSFEYRLASDNPGFSMVAIDPGARRGVVIVEFHGFRNQVNTRMHIELTRAVSDQWYAYWLGQFERIWLTAQAPEAR